MAADPTLSLQVGAPHAVRREDLETEVPLDAETRALMAELSGDTDIRVSARAGFEDAFQLDKSSLEKGWEYRFCHKNPTQIARRKAQGYRVVDPKKEVIKNFAGDRVHVDADNTYTVGDTILMKCPSNIHTARRTLRNAQAVTRLASDREALVTGFRERARKAGVSENHIQVESRTIGGDSPKEGGG
jgi:hypothetical protein